MFSLGVSFFLAEHAVACHNRKKSCLCQLSGLLRCLGFYLFDTIVWADVGHNVSAIPDLPHGQVVGAVAHQAVEELGVFQLNGHSCICALVPVMELVIVLAGACQWNKHSTCCDPTFF